MQENSSKNELTICTVSFGQRKIIEENIRLVNNLNPRIHVDWIIVENGPIGMDGRFNQGMFSDGIVLQGIENKFQGIAPASYHHASGLNMAIREVKTRFALILDPDFYIVRPNWISDLIIDLTKNNIMVWGVPYNPKRYMKYRYFPCIHCMLIDLKWIDKKELDFSPKYKQNNALIGQQKKIETGGNFDGLKKLYLELKRFAKLMLKRNSIIGSSRDTGYGIYERFNSDWKTKSAFAKPVFKFGKSDVKPRYLNTIPNRLLEKFLPEKLCYIPKRTDYFSTKGFKEYGLPDIFSKGWDEFVWKDMPFGFHLQGATKDGSTSDHSSDIPRLQEIFKMCKNTVL